MSRVNTRQELAQGPALGWGQAWEGRVEVGLILLAGVFGLK
jgi:hypothetical protein